MFPWFIHNAYMMRCLTRDEWVLPLLTATPRCSDLLVRKNNDFVCLARSLGLERARCTPGGSKYYRQETQLAILGVALAITLYNAIVLEPTAQVALEEELVRPTFFLLRSFDVYFPKNVVGSCWLYYGRP